VASVKYLFSHSESFFRCQSLSDDGGWESGRRVIETDSDVDKCQKQTSQTFEMSHGVKFINQSNRSSGPRSSTNRPRRF
jgi:hypothetical protein